MNPGWEELAPVTTATKDARRSQERSGRRPFAVAAIVGVGLGVFSILADGIVDWRAFVILGNLASPWGLAAFLIGLRTTSLRKGALAGALALLLGVATYYVGVALRGYVFGGANAVWTVVAVVAGPIMGQSGAAVSARRERPPVAAVAAPAAMLLAEAIFFVIDRRIWLYDLRTQPYRLVDLGIVALLLAGALVIPVRFAKDRRPLVYLVVAAAGACGALGFQASYRLIVAIT